MATFGPLEYFFYFFDQAEDHWEPCIELGPKSKFITDKLKASSYIPKISLIMSFK